MDKEITFFMIVGSGLMKVEMVGYFYSAICGTSNAITINYKVVLIDGGDRTRTHSLFRS
jgi:hypothetical protein